MTGPSPSLRAELSSETSIITQPRQRLHQTQNRAGLDEDASLLDRPGESTDLAGNDGQPRRHPLHGRDGRALAPATGRHDRRHDQRIRHVEECRTPPLVDLPQESNGKPELAGTRLQLASSRTVSGDECENTPGGIASERFEENLDSLDRDQPRDDRHDQRSLASYALREPSQLLEIVGRG